MSLQYAILGLLKYKAMSGYDLKAVFDNSINFFWSAKLSQIYRELGSLEAKGYVSSVIEAQEKRPDRKVYSITEEGIQALTSWLQSFPPVLSVPLRDEFIVHVFFGSQIANEELEFQFKKLIKEQQEIISLYRGVEGMMTRYAEGSSQPFDRFYWELTLKRGFIIAEANIRWAEECLQELRKRKTEPN